MYLEIQFTKKYTCYHYDKIIRFSKGPLYKLPSWTPVTIPMNSSQEMHHCTCILPFPYFIHIILLQLETKPSILDSSIANVIDAGYFLIQQLNLLHAT